MKKMKKFMFMFVAFMSIGVMNAQASTEKIDSILTNGKLILKSIKPASVEEVFSVIGSALESNFGEGYGINPESCNADFTSCSIEYYGENGNEVKTVEIVYNYDENIKKVVRQYVSKIPEGKTEFEVRDLELVNYWLANGEDEFSKYSGEFKGYVDYKNFAIDARMGADDFFITEYGGIGQFVYEGTTYYAYPQMIFSGHHVLYVPSDTGSTSNALITAIQKRIDDYVGKDKVVVSLGGTVTDFYNNYWNSLTNVTCPLVEQNMGGVITMVSDYSCESTKSQNILGKNNFYNAYNTTGGYYNFLKSAVGDYYFIATVGNEQYKFIINKDSTKMVAPTYKSSDLSSDVTVSTTSGVVPLDTMIKVSKLTAGANYDKIMKILNVTNSEMFDLNLYSGTLEGNFTELADGSFEVKIPISDKFKGKNLVVYYVDDDGFKQEYTVTVEDDYAIFNTKHFSIYTLAEVVAVADNKTKEETTKEETINPPTNDGILSYICLGSVSLVGMLGFGLYLNQKKRFN